MGDEETFAEAVFHKRWLLALERSGVTTVGQLIRMRQHGVAVAEIAPRFGISRGRVR